MRKNVIILVSIMLLLPLLTSIAIADSENTYYLKTIELTVTVPKGYTVFTRDMKADDPNLAKYGFTKDYLLSTMKAQQTYIEALSGDGLTEMYVAMFVDSGMDDFSKKSDATLKALIDELLPQYASMGITMEKGEVYQHSQTKFIKLYGKHTVSGMTVYTRQYSTVYNGHTYNFTMQSFSGKISSSQEKDLQSFVDNAVFGADATATSTTAPSSSFVYTDQKTGLKFTVPAGWKEEPLSKKRNTIDVKFVSETDIFAHIFYGSIDMWESIPESERSGLSRADINSSLFSSEEIEAILGSYYSGSPAVSISNVKTVTYNGIEYYYLESETSSNGITLPITQLIRIDNGYTYLFQYYGSRDSEYYSDFKNLLSSATYVSAPAATQTITPTATAKPTATVKPTATAKAVATEKPYTATTTPISNYNRNAANSGMWATIIGIAIWALIPGFIARKKGRSFAGYFFLSFLITPLVTMIITLCLKDRNKESEKSSSFKQEEQPVKDLTVAPATEKTCLNDNDTLHEGPSTKVFAEPQVTDAPAVAEQPSNGPSIPIHESDNNLEELEPNQPVVSSEVADNDIPVSEPEQEDQPLLFCRYCGFKLLDNSEFCSHCGKKVR